MFRDPFVDVQGLEALQSYLAAIDDAGMRPELFKLLLQSPRRRTPAATPRWEVVADVYLHVPYPDWYRDYALLHDRVGAATEGVPETPVGSVDLEALKVPLFPRGEALRAAGIVGEGPTTGRTAQEQGSGQRNAQRQAPVLSLPRHVPCFPRRRADWIVQNPGPLEDEGVEGPIAGVGLPLPAPVRRPGDAPILWEPERRAVLGLDPKSWKAAASRFYYAGITGAGHQGCWRLAGGPPGEDPRSPAAQPGGDRSTPSKRRSKPSRATASQKMRWPEVPDPEALMTREEAKARLQAALGPHFDSVMAQLPKPGRNRGVPGDDPGASWTRGEHFTVGVSFRFRIDSASGRVDGITGTWGGVAGALSSAFDAVDIYLRSSGALWMGLEDEV